ncbi:MAG: hypothetical protein K8T10_11835 [Candidatus Eremiobacteraeota bacterium]|nr:hypothetical protein [Candidatus Eremiobacteraeota bacterium]
MNEKSTPEKISDKRIRKERALLLFFLFLLPGFMIFFNGCGEEKDTLLLPLEKGDTFTYSGELISKSGSGKKIKMTAPKHRIVVKREYERDGRKFFIIDIYQGDYWIMAMSMSQEEEGLCWMMGKKSKFLMIPRNVKKGQKWECKIGSREIKATVGGTRKFKTGLGELVGREIFYNSGGKSFLKIWINNDVGIIAIEFSRISDSANRQEAKLILQKCENNNKE